MAIGSSFRNATSLKYGWHKASDAVHLWFGLKHNSPISRSAAEENKNNGWDTTAFWHASLPIVTASINSEKSKISSTYLEKDLQKIVQDSEVIKNKT